MRGGLFCVFTYVGATHSLSYVSSRNIRPGYLILLGKGFMIGVCINLPTFFLSSRGSS